MRLAGIDGCKAGWVAAIAEAGEPYSARLAFADRLDLLLASVDFAVVDMPIGLIEGPDPRDVEVAMRAHIRGKASSVFPTPCRAALKEHVYGDASFVNETALGRRLPRQSFMLFPKLREVDAVVRELGQERLREGHPEVSFREMAGAPLLSKKREADGRAERKSLLESLGFPVQSFLDALVRGAMAADDVLDAAALLWSAERFRRGRHITLPPAPSRDSAGLEMSVIA